MSIFKINVTAINPQKPDKKTLPVEVLVDSGSELTWLPASKLKRIGIKLVNPPYSPDF